MNNEGRNTDKNVQNIGENHENARGLRNPRGRNQRAHRGRGARGGRGGRGGRRNMDPDYVYRGPNTSNRPVAIPQNYVRQMGMYFTILRHSILRMTSVKSQR